MEPPTSASSELLSRARAIAQDHDSGASELTTRLLGVLADALHAGDDVVIEIARVVLTAQPVMASLWHACAAAVIERHQPGTFERRRAEMERAPRALIRAASAALRDLFAGDSRPAVLTLSYSSSVAHVLRELLPAIGLRVVCAEGRPRYEGRRLARELADSGTDVTVVVDAALTTMLPGASAVVMGADAVMADRWINKVGSLGIAAGAALTAVPVYVVAGRDKFVPRLLASRITPAPSGPDEVWSDRPAAIRVENTYFESTPIDLATLFLTEMGPLGPGDASAAAERHARELTLLLSRLS